MTPSSPPPPEAWLRGPVPGVSTSLQPVAHALVQALEDVERLAGTLPPERLWKGPGAAAPVGFHLRHMAGSLDRLLTYARGEGLSEMQREALLREREVSGGPDAEALLASFRATVESALDQLRATREDELDDLRTVGRAALPSSVRGLLHHAGEHTARHAGQVSTTVLALQGNGPGKPDRE